MIPCVSDEGGYAVVSIVIHSVLFSEFQVELFVRQ